MRINPYGEVVLAEPDLFDLLYQGADISGTVVDLDPEITRYNDLCRINDKTEFVVNESVCSSPLAEYHRERQARWFVPSAYLDLDVWATLFERCNTEAERDRLREEQIAYEERGLRPLLSLMIYLVDCFRERNIVWGVGRGSSVASFTLYLIGIIKINPMLFDLDIGEFLKD